MFGAMALALMAIGFLLPRFPVVTLSVFLFALLMFRSWLSPEFPWGIESYALWIMAIGLAVTLSRWFYKHPQGALRFLRRSLPILVVAAVLAFLGIQGGSWLKERLAVAGLPPSAPDAPNIMVIVVDTLRADHLSSYGYMRPTSSNIDHLAQQGVLFESAFSTAPWTAPSHASLLTGRYPYEHQAFWIGESCRILMIPIQCCRKPFKSRVTALPLSLPTPTGLPGGLASDAALCASRTSFIPQ
jgi:Sulfatase